MVAMRSCASAIPSSTTALNAEMQSPLHTLVGLIVIVNPLLAISAFSALTGGDDAAERKATAYRAALTVATVLILAALVGEQLLAIFGISLPAFQVGGGILILLMAIAMLHARMSGTRHTDEEAEDAQSKEQVGIVPLGIPLLAGPGAITTVIIYSHASVGWLHKAILVGEIAVVGALVWLSLRLGDRLAALLGATGVNIATRIMGLLLAAIAVEFIAKGAKTLLPGLA